MMASKPGIYVFLICSLIVFVLLNSELISGNVARTTIETSESKNRTDNAIVTSVQSTKTTALGSYQSNLKTKENEIKESEGVQKSHSETLETKTDQQDDFAVPQDETDGFPGNNQTNPEKDEAKTTESYKGNDENENDYFPLPSDFHVCKLKDPEPEFKAAMLTERDSPVMKKILHSFRYQCAGQPYEDYMTKHQFPFVLKRHQEDPTLQWGKRPSILPPDAKGKKILIIGNSHTRQMIESLLCMYQDQIELAESLTLEGSSDVCRQYTIANDNIITTMMNPYCIYSPKWKQNLEKYYLNHSLAELDAIVLGSFNHYNPNYPNARFWKNAITYNQNYPEQQVDPIEHDPFHLVDLARIYDGPIVWTSMTARYAQSYHDMALRQMALPEFQHRTNFRSIYGRQYVDGLDGVECGVPSLKTVGTCVEDPKAIDYSDGHRCIGALGGPPDLIAWDVVESLWDVLEKSAR